MLNRIKSGVDIMLMTEDSEEGQNGGDLDLELKPNYTGDWKLSPNVECRVTLEKMKSWPSGKEFHRNDSEVNVRSVESCDMYLKMKQLVDELFNTFEKCNDRCRLCDKYIIQLHMHFIQTHGRSRSRSRTTNFCQTNPSTSFSSNHSNSSDGISDNQCQAETAASRDRKIASRDNDESSVTATRDIKPQTTAINSSPLVTLEHFNHFSLIEAILKQEPDDNVCQEDPLVNTETASLNFEGDMDSTENVVSRDEGQLRVTSAKIALTHTHFKNSLGNTRARFNAQTQNSEKSKLFNCLSCGKCFPTRGSLTRHKMSHTGESSRFMCEVCGKCFTCSSELIIHQRTHTGERPFICSACGNCYITERNLEIHKVKMHSELTVHQRTHTEEQAFKCGLCGQSFSSNTNFSIHKKLKHKG